MKLDQAHRHTLKIISVFFAISLWFYVLNSEPIEIEKKIAIEYLLPKGYTISSLEEKELTVKLKGSKAFISSVFSSKEKLTVDLNPYYQKYGKFFKVLFYSSQIPVPFGVDILDIHPKEKLVEIDRLVKMEIPVKIRYIGEMSYEKKWNEVSLNPSSIMVSGPVEIIRKLSYIESNPVNLSNVTRDEGTMTVPLMELDSRLSYEENPRVKLKYKVELIIPKRNEPDKNEK